MRHTSTESANRWFVWPHPDPERHLQLGEGDQIRPTLTSKDRPHRRVIQIRLGGHVTKRASDHCRPQATRHHNGVPSRNHVGDFTVGPVAGDDKASRRAKHAAPGHAATVLLYVSSPRNSRLPIERLFDYCCVFATGVAG